MFDDTLKILIRTLSISVVTALLSGCFVTVKHTNGGSVTGEDGSNCQNIFCTYQLFEGDSFSQKFTAEANEGSQFVRWDDSLGNSFFICRNPTIPECQLNIPLVLPGLEMQSLDVEAVFEPVTGFNINRVEFENEDEDLLTFEQTGEDEWMLIGREEGPISYLESDRSLGKIILIDRHLPFSYIIDLGFGEVSSQSSEEDPEFVGKVERQSAERSGYLATGIRFGNRLGQYRGDFVEMIDRSWVKNPRNSDEILAVYSTVQRDRGMVTLTNDLTGETVEIDIAAGTVISKNSMGETLDESFVHRVNQSVAGFIVSEVRFSTDAGDITGSFLQTEGDNWVETRAPGDAVVETYELTSRTRDEVKLTSKNNTLRRLTLNLDSREISEQVGITPPVYLYQIDEVR